MYANYIKREVADLNGTGMTQAYYKMALKPMTFEQLSNCAIVKVERMKVSSSA